ncbi:MAG: Asp-tRNA(Asn)/Glu-tRNA(Gln) amidotransferase subunit GatC [Tissierella sp.]|uniref:Asp-tRNA(Asn)/Glu-tRNA(Gln) amidotransferase subunit GatC n=1 Tax=Tissierella sp. TaxID=41274 RepID=UPI003F96A67C
MIDKKEVKNLADLCKINVSEEEMEVFEKDLNSFLAEVEGLKDIDTSGVDITYNVNNMKNPLRNEKVWESLKREEVVKNTAEEQYGYFKILKVMD